MQLSPEQEARINSAAEMGIQHAQSSGMPYSQVRDFIAVLGTDPDWTDAEIVEVQSRIIRWLLRHEQE